MQEGGRQGRGIIINDTDMSDDDNNKKKNKQDSRKGAPGGWLVG
jgi:hypothetical protein